jgi:hypothetical protein
VEEADSNDELVIELELMVVTGVTTTNGKPDTRVGALKGNGLDTKDSVDDVFTLIVDTLSTVFERILEETEGDKGNSSDWWISVDGVWIMVVVVRVELSVLIGEVVVEDSICNLVLVSVVKYAECVILGDGYINPVDIVDFCVITKVVSAGLVVLEEAVKPSSSDPS